MTDLTILEAIDWIFQGGVRLDKKYLYKIYVSSDSKYLKYTTDDGVEYNYNK